MAEREIPQWWVDAFLAAMKARGWSPSDTAAQLAGLTEDQPREGNREHQARKTAISRITKHRRGPSETIEEICKLLDLPEWAVEARDPEHARDLALVRDDPARLRRALAAEALMIKLQSGELDIDRTIGRHTPGVEPEHERRSPERGRRRGSRARPEAPGKKR